MPKKPPPRDPISAYARNATTARRIGNKKCPCGETLPLAFANRKSQLCGECERERRGHKTTDNHHVAGKANNRATIPVRTNDHRARLSPDQHDWPEATLENADGCPLLAAAACIRGFVDYVYYAIEKYLLWIPEMLEALSVFLKHKLGRQWWHNTPLDRFSPKRKRDVFP